MGNELIPELHDCLKLTTLQHNFADFDRFLKYAPNTRSWNGVLQHHCKITKENEETFPAWPTDRDTFLLHMADGIAANFSRHSQTYRRETSFALHKVWKAKYSEGDKRLKEDGEIIELLKFYQADPTFDDFVKRYGYILQSRPEDAHVGMNVTSLYTHLILTGKFYRFFKRSTTLRVEENEIKPTPEGIGILTERKMKEWQIYLARCKFHFHQNPIRARDMNILEHLETTIKEIEAQYYDNLLFSSSDEILLYYDEDSVLESIRAIAGKNGLWMSVVRARKQLEELKGLKAYEPSRLPNHKEENLYGLLSDSISPPICEICQMAKAERIWPADYLRQFGGDTEVTKDRTEDLCKLCFDIRCRPSKLKKLREWTEKENVGVIWMKIDLDYDLLTTVLGTSYLEYLRQTNPNANQSDAGVRFSMVYEFQQDYNEFIRSFTENLFKSFGLEQVESILKDMFCIRSERTTIVFQVLKIFSDTLEEYFPDFRGLPQGPIKASLTCCNSKFPFFEVWRGIQEQTSTLQISLIGHGRIETSFAYLEQMLLAAKMPYKKSSFHKLAEISKLSEKLAELKFNDRSEREDYTSYEDLKRTLLPLGMDFQSILTFTKLVGG